MSVYSLFFSASIAAYDNNVDDADYAETSTRFVHGQRYNVLYRKIEDIVIDEGESRVLTFAQGLSASRWVMLIAEVNGWARFDTVGVDFDGSTPITGRSPSYGTAMYPGKLHISTYNLSSVTIVGLQDSTKIKLLAATPCPDNDARYVENA